MAERTVTIRARAEGTVETAQRFQQLSKDITRETAQLAKDVVAAQKNASTEMGPALAATAQAQAAHVARLWKMQATEFSQSYRRQLAEAKDQTEKAVAGGMGLRGFGGKMIMAHAAGMAAGDILGDQHGGRELGAVAGAMMFGGPEITAAVAGLELVGSAFRGAAEDAKIFAKAIEESNAQVLEAVRAERDRARSLIPTTKAGEQYRAEEKSLQAEIDKVQAQMAMVRASGGFGSSVAQIGEETINFFGAGMVTQEDAKRQAIGSATKEQAFLQKKLNEAREKASKEESIAWASEMTKNDRARQILERPERERDLRIGQMAEDVRPQQWTADQIAARVDSEMALQNSRFALQQTAELHPEREFNALKMKLDRAAAQGSLSDADEVYLLKKNARDLLHGTMGGEFTSATGHWESVQSQIIQKADLPQQTLEEIRQVRKQLELLNRGVKIAA